MNKPNNIRSKYTSLGDLIINKVTQYVASNKIFALCSTLLGLVILMVIWLPCPSKSQYLTIKLLSAFSVAGLISLLPNFFNARDRKKWQVGGSLLAFFSLLIWNPSSIVLKDNCSTMMSVAGTVWLGDTPVSGASVKSPELNEADETNNSGSFDLPFDATHLNKPISISVNYRGLSRKINVDQLRADLELPIHLADTLPVLNDPKALQLVMLHVQQRERQIRQEAQKLLRINRGREIDHEILTQKLTAWQQLGGRVKNSVTFTNGFWRLDTQREINEAGLIQLPIDFTASWYFQKPIVYLLNWEYGIRDKERLSTLKLEYVVLEKEPLTTRANGALRKNTKLDGRIQINHKHPLRLVHVSLEYSPATHWFKQSKTRLLGYLPSELYLLEYKNTRWQVTNTINPGKTS